METQENYDFLSSYGARLVDYNQNAIPRVRDVKKAYADIINNLSNMSANSHNPDVKRACAIAVTETEGACMRAVRAAYWAEQELAQRTEKQND